MTLKPLQRRNLPSGLGFLTPVFDSVERIFLENQRDEELAQYFNIERNSRFAFAIYGFMNFNERITNQFALAINTWEVETAQKEALFLSQVSKMFETICDSSGFMDARKLKEIQGSFPNIDMLIPIVDQETGTNVFFFKEKESKRFFACSSKVNQDGFYDYVKLSAFNIIEGTEFPKSLMFDVESVLSEHALGRNGMWLRKDLFSDGIDFVEATLLSA